MSVFEPCQFSKLAKGAEPGFIPSDSFVGGVLLEVDDHEMGDPSLDYRESMERLRGKF